MELNITPLVNAVLGILATLITAYLVPWIKAKAKIAKAQMSETQIYTLKVIAQVVVTAAAQIYTDNQQKLDYALETFENICAQRGLVYDSAEARAYIEQAVMALKGDAPVTVSGITVNEAAE